ncbi:MAG: twin-arginine translocation signal domain-containing protein, partial [Bradymonadaceae bacterium]
MKYHSKRQPLDRRTFLKGTVGGATVTVGLPFLEAMAGSSPRTLAEAEPEEPPSVEAKEYLAEM